MLQICALDESLLSSCSNLIISQFILCIDSEIEVLQGENSVFYLIYAKE